MISRYQEMISQGIIPDILISANAVPRVNIYRFIKQSHFTNIFAPGGEQLEHHKLAHDKQPTAGCTDSTVPTLPPGRFWSRQRPKSQMHRNSH